MTERRQRDEEALRENKQLVEKTLNSLRDAIFVLDANTLQIIECNPAASEIFGYSREEMLGRTTTFRHVDEAALEEFRRILYPAIEENGFLEHFEFRMKRKDGSIFPTEHRVMPLVDEKGNRTGWVSMVRDNTEREEMQEQLMRQEKLAAVGRLSSSVAHELRNPLGVIGNSAYYLNMKLKDADEKVRKHLGILQREVNRSNRIISNLLDFSRAVPLSLVEVDVNGIVKETLAEIKIPEDIGVEIRLDENLPGISLDPDQIGQVFLNIIYNAFQAMPEGGKLEIKTNPEKDFVEIVFRDTGEGIPEETLEKIFEPLLTTRAKGIGLGLAIVKGIIEKHKGRIEVESEVGKGTAFTVKLPIKR